MKRIILILPVIICLSCALAQPTKEELGKATFGAPLSIDYRTAIKLAFASTLIDPMSAQYIISEPRKCWVRIHQTIWTKKKLYTGYGILVDVNAKNRFGGYTGYKQYFTLWRDNESIWVQSIDALYGWSFIYGWVE